MNEKNQRQRKVDLDVAIEETGSELVELVELRVCC